MREQANIAEVAGAFAKLEEHYRAEKKADDSSVGEFEKNKQTQLRRLDADSQAILENWEATLQNYRNPEYVYAVRGKEIRVQTHTKSLSGNMIPKVSVPRYTGWGDRLRWAMQENFPGEFPYTAGVFPFKREGEDPTRMFAGEGGPEADKPPLPLREPGPARQAPEHGLRLGDALRRGPRFAARHLRQNRQCRREHCLPRRCQEAVLGLQPG